MDIKIFRLFRSDDMYDESEVHSEASIEGSHSASQPVSRKSRNTNTKNTKSVNSKQGNDSLQDKMFSLRDLLKQTQAFVNDKIFQIIHEENQNENFRFVHLKIKKILSSTNKNERYRKERILLQIIDVSDKMLYNEVKAE